MINWAKLYSQGRVKAMGIPWSAEEQTALHEFRIPVEYVRDGILTLEAYTKALEAECDDGKPVERLALEDLKKQATELGIDFTPEVNADALVKLINKELKNKANTEKQEAIVAGAVLKHEEEESKAKAKAQLKAEKEKEKLKKLSEKGGKNV